MATKPFVLVLTLAVLLGHTASADPSVDHERPKAASDSTIDETKTLPLKNDFSIWMDNHIVAEFEKTSQGWKNKDQKAYTNWKFFEDFLDSLQDFHVDFHLTADEVKPNSSSFELRQGSRTFLFSKVGERTWAVKWPNATEFLASRNFSIYGDMEASIWASPFEKNLRILKDPTASPASRIIALRTVMTSESADVKAVMQSVLVKEGENEELRQEIVTAMRRTPTDQNMKILMGVLQTSKDELLLNQISKVLRVRNPKGPVIQLDDEDHEVQRKIATWQAWGNRFK
jgi:hypothetical protein